MSFSGSRTRRKRMPSLVGSGGERTASRTDVGPLCWPQVMLILTKRGVDQLVAALGDEPPDPALLGLPQRTTRSRSRMLLKLQPPQRIEGAAGLRRARAYGTETLCHLAYHLVTGTLNLGWAFFGTGAPSRARTLRTRTPRTRACAPRSRAPAPREGSATTPGPPGLQVSTLSK